MNELNENSNFKIFNQVKKSFIMNIAIITNKSYNHSETFIKAQIDNLPFQIHHYWGRKLPFNVKVDQPSLLLKILAKIGVVSKKSHLSIFLKDLQLNNIELVLAQYGMIGDAVLEACKNLNLPLVVHFHGHDAVRKSVLEGPVFL